MFKTQTQYIVEFITICDSSDNSNTEAGKGEMRGYYYKVSIVYRKWYNEDRE